MPISKVFAAKTGTGRSSVVSVGGPTAVPITAFLTGMVYGGTPTFTVTLDGSMDGGATWLTGTGAAAGTFTSGAQQTLSLVANQFFPLVSLNISANTNVTAIDAYISFPSNIP